MHAQSVTLLKMLSVEAVLAFFFALTTGARGKGAGEGAAKFFFDLLRRIAGTGTGEDVSERYLAYRGVDGVARDGPEDWMVLSADCLEVSSARIAHPGCIGLHNSTELPMTREMRCVRFARLLRLDDIQKFTLAYCRYVTYLMISWLLNRIKKKYVAV